MAAKSVSRIVFWASVATLVAGACYYLSSRTSVSAAGPSASVSVIDGQDSQWVREFVGGARVEFVNSSDGAKKSPSSGILTLDLLPKLAGADLKRAFAMVAPESNLQAMDRARQIAEETGSLIDYTAFLMELAATEKFRACTEMLHAGDYAVVKPFTQLPKIPDEFLVLQVSNFRMKEPEGKCDLCFFIDKERYPRARDTWSAYTEALASVHDSECRVFNEKSLKLRTDEILAHDQALRVIAASDDKLSASLESVRKSVIPGRFVIDREFYMLRPRGVELQ